MTDDTIKMPGIQEIFDLLPHRYPFLLVDRVLEYTPRESIVALKNVTINEPFFQGHFPGLPIMPGVLILEALAQAGGILTLLSEPAFKDKLLMFTGIDKVRFKRPVVPGDQLKLCCFNVKHKFQLIKMETQALVDGEVVQEGHMSAAMIEKDTL